MLKSVFTVYQNKLCIHTVTVLRVYCINVSRDLDKYLDLLMEAEMVRQICKRTFITLFDQNNFNGSPDRRIHFNLFYYFKHHTTYGNTIVNIKCVVLLYNVCPKCFCFDTYANSDRSEEGMSSSKACVTARSNGNVFMSGVCSCTLESKRLYVKRLLLHAQTQISLCKVSVTEQPF